MKKIIGLFCFILVTLFLYYANANAATTIIIYGTGGVQVWPPAVCPKESTNKCAEIKFGVTIPTDPNGDPVFVGLVGTLCYKDQTFPNITVAEQPNYIKTPTGYEFYGGLRISADEQTLQRLIELGEPSEPSCPGF